MEITDNLAAFWILDEPSGNAIDAHGPNHLAELSGTVGTNRIGATVARDFERGDSECLYSPDADWNDLGATDFTFAALVNLESLVAGGQFAAVFSKDGSAVAQREATLYYQGTGSRFHFVVANSGGSTDLVLDSIGAPSTATAYFLVVWFDGEAQKIYGQVNGGPVDEASHTHGIRNGTGDFLIGGILSSSSGSAPSHQWDGCIARAGLWKRVLTADERTWLFNNGSARTYIELEAGIRRREGLTSSALNPSSIGLYS